MCDSEIEHKAKIKWLPILFSYQNRKDIIKAWTLSISRQEKSHRNLACWNAMEKTGFQGILLNSDMSCFIVKMGWWAWNNNEENETSARSNMYRDVTKCKMPEAARMIPSTPGLPSTSGHGTHSPPCPPLYRHFSGCSFQKPVTSMSWLWCTGVLDFHS